MPLLFWAAAAASWAIALAWIWRAGTMLYHYSDVPDLCDQLYDPHLLSVDGRQSIAVIVPALNEAASIGTCLRSLLESRGVRLEIVAVDDRSTDETGAIMDQMAQIAQIAQDARQGEEGHSLRVLHIEKLPPGWLGKPHALALGASMTTSPFLMFTDSDAFYAPDALARSLRFLEHTRADHLVLMPTPILKSAGERMMLGMMQALAIWPVRLWKVPDPRASDSVGVGCFNLLRREAYQGIGGFNALRMEVLEDLRLGYLVKHHGYRQSVAFGHDLLRLHWASGALGIVHGLSKNFFALCRYSPLMMVVALCGTATMTLGPVLGLMLDSTVLPSMLTMIVLAGLYLRNAKRTGISAGYLLLFPVASCLFLYGMARSAVITLARGGVSWRGTFYPLAALRSHAGRLR